MTEWLISGNPQNYDLINAFRDLGTIDWKQSTNIVAGDIVYIYVSEGYQAVKYKCRANKVDLKVPDIDDAKYNISGKYDGTYGRYMELEMLEELQGALYGRTLLEKYGFSAPQRAVRVSSQVKDYLDVVQFLQHSEELNPDKHDGCYEFMREIVKSFATMNEYSQLDYKDLNLVYFSCIGTWTYGYDKKKRDILESHLPESEKARLVDVLQEIQDKADKKAYENSERNQPSIGMFGTGFKSFVCKTDKDSARRFIEMCVDILPMEDDDALFNRAEKVINSTFKGMRAASASVVLHTLKPYSFPIINGNQSNGNMFQYLGVELKRASEIGTYIDNCRTIKAFRDKHFKIKNYRIFDRAIWSVGRGNHTDIDYLGILEYLEDNANAKYVNPENPSLSTEEKEKYLELKVRGQYVVDEYKKITNLAYEKFKLQSSGQIQWLDGSNTKLRRYLWTQLKYDKHMDEPYSVALHTIIDPKTNKARFKVSLEVKNDDADESVMKKYHSYLDIEQSTLMQYLAGSDSLEDISLITDSIDVIKQKVASREYKKVQPCIFINWSEDLTNDSCEEQVIKAIETVLPYYKYVIGDAESEWWPSKTEYDPGLTVEQWVSILKNPEITYESNLRMFAIMLDYGKHAACSELAERYGETYNFFNRGSSAMGKRVVDKRLCPAPPERDNENARWWPVLYVGRDAGKGEKGIYIWKLRDELKSALEQMELPIVEEKNEMTGKKEFGLNTILYGPPGTGKTYKTVCYAVAICEPDLDVDSMEYVDVLEKYNELKKEGRIDFTTFHQSYGYEEFIEGIKPIMASDSGDNQGKDVMYDVIPGVFKTFCENASKKKVETKGFDISEDAHIWKVTVRGQVRQDCFDNNRVRIDWAMDSDGANGFVNDMIQGDIILTTDGNRKRINGIAVVTSEDAYEFDDNEDKVTRDVKWLAKDIDVDITDINTGKMLHRMTCARVPKMNVADIVSVATAQNQALSGTVIEENTVPYVFIIDEINRGNISKIFGELITLIEETKRAGAKEAMETTLPYSGDSFSVPKNVYILGTMNTADRSIALMDTALRRRFDFKEMMPDTGVISGITVSEDGKIVDIEKMLKTINDRIEYLYDREHTIGHAFFTGLPKEGATVSQLGEIFKNKVVPLLQEYFYEDYEKIQLVLGDNDKSDDAYKFILDERVDERRLFKGSPDLDLKEKTYKIQDDAFDLIQSYVEITETHKEENTSEQTS